VQRHQSGALVEAEALYRQVLASEPRNADALHLLGVACSQQGRHDEAVELILKASKIAPASAAMHLNLGNALLGAGRHSEAVARYRKALALEPRNAIAHRNLGSALNALNRPAEAEACYRKSVAVQPSYAEAHYGLGVTLMELDRNEEAIPCLERALALRPNFADAHNNLGGALRCLNRYREALASVEKALTLEPDHADAHWNRSVVRLALGDYRGGWEDYEWRRRAALRSKPSEFAQPLWLGQSALSGKTILLHAEQGLGDTLQFVRYAPLVAQLGARVMLQVQAPLKRLLAGMEGVSAVYSIGEALPGFDGQCPMMSLPHALGTELADIPAATPYLRADPAGAGRWRARLTKGAPNVGLVWAGAAREHDVRANRVDRRRSLSLAQLEPLSGAGVRLVSLQKGPPGKEARPPPPGMEVLDPTSELDDFADTAALVEALDLVISVDTSVAHLAGALGKPVWILSRFDGCWRWLLDRDDSPWYPTARLFRQRAPGDWDTVIARVAQALSAWGESMGTPRRQPGGEPKKSPPGGR